MTAPRSPGGRGSPASPTVTEQAAPLPGGRKDVTMGDHAQHRGRAPVPGAHPTTRAPAAHRTEGGIR